MNFQKVVSKPPRALELVDRNPEEPIGRKPLARGEGRRRAATIAGEVAAGRLPLDEVTGPQVARALADQYRQVRRGGA